MTKDGKLKHFEIKNWNSSKSVNGTWTDTFGKNVASCLLSSMKAKVCKTNPDIEKGGQLFDDFAHIFKDPKNIDITWIFNGVRGGDVKNIRNELFNNIAKDPDVLLPLIKKSENQSLLNRFLEAKEDTSKMEVFLVNDVKKIIDRVFQKGKNLTDINQ